VLDAVKGTIRLYSPTHKSEIVLGRSFEFWCLSDWKVQFGGKEVKVIEQSKHENILGLSSKLIGGVKQETVVGSEIKINLVNKNEVVWAKTYQGKWGTEFIHNKAKSNKKAPTLVDLIEQHKTFVDKQETKAKELREKAKKAELAADDYQLRAEAFKSKGKNLDFEYASKMAIKSAKWQQEADDLEQNVKTAKILAQMIKLG